MFETTRQTLGLIGIFAAVGFALGFFYNIVKFIRLTFTKASVLNNALDLIFMLFSAFVLFVFSVEYGTGFFRLYYVFSALVGFLLYTVTLGFLTRPLSKLFRALLCAVSGLLSRYFVSPIRKIIVLIKQNAALLFGKIHKIVSNFIEFHKIHLKKDRKAVYNKNNSKKAEGGESRNVIKAKVRRNA